MAIFKEYLTLSDFEAAKKPFDETNETYYINEDDEATLGTPDFKWNNVVFCAEGKFIMTRRVKYDTNHESPVYYINDDLFTKVSGDSLSDLWIQHIDASTSDRVKSHEEIYNILSNQKNTFFIGIGTADKYQVTVEENNNTFYLSYEDNITVYDDGTSVKYCIGIKYDSTKKAFSLVNGVARQTLTWTVLGWEYYLSCYATPSSIVYYNGDFVCLYSGYKKNQATGEYSQLSTDDISIKYNDTLTQIPIVGYWAYLSKWMQNSSGDIRVISNISTSYSDRLANDSDATMWYYWMKLPTLVVEADLEEKDPTKTTFTGITQQNSTNGIENPSCYLGIREYAPIGRQNVMNYTEFGENLMWSYFLNWGRYHLTLSFAYVGKSYNSWGATMFSTTKDPFPSSLTGNEIQLYISTDGRVKLLTYDGEAIVTDVIFPNRDTASEALSQYSNSIFEIDRNGDNCYLFIYNGNNTYQYNATIHYEYQDGTKENISYVSCKYGKYWVLNSNMSKYTYFMEYPIKIEYSTGGQPKYIKL